MKKMRIANAFVAASFLAILLISFANASLDIGVSVKDPQINKLQSQIIIPTTNQPGKGILFVLQPAEGDPWEGFLITHPILAGIWNSLSSDTQAQVLEKIGDKLLSYKLISTELAENNEIFALPEVAFPDDFTGINGIPSTALEGVYKVVFIFLSQGPLDQVTQSCSVFELDFAVASWFVVPEIPLGTIAPILSALGALPVLKLYRRKHA